MPRQIVRHAPYLRRYARALTGGQDAGDALVRIVMERVLDGTVALDEELPIRIALYRALHQVWSGASDDIGGGSERDAPLRLLSPSQRAALLLVGVEDFSPGEAASVLGVSVDDLQHRLAEAEADLARQLSTPVLIIEDEPIIALDLTRLVLEVGHRVIGVAATHAEAVEMAQDERPGLLLADVRLADGSSGIDAAAQIIRHQDIPVIFITAFPEHLLTGERAEPAFLITKPFREEAVKAIIAQALYFHDPAGDLQIA